MEDAVKKLLNLQPALQPTRQATPAPRPLQELFLRMARLAEHPGDEAWFELRGDKQSYKGR
uniref:Uncharacterized protein n=2 Tax=Setaria TaxID=4554 RepID=A0A4U6VFU4_SETVI|nr:hypothetical protein SEVIR_3G168800v2 [Setaria viridis]